MTRGYGQFCGLARALELVGGRWTLLIVRDLLLGPKRFTELQEGLPGIPSNILSSRLRELEEAGLVERTLLSRHISSVGYALTPYGRELEDSVLRLGLWGAKALGRPDANDFFPFGSLPIALRTAFEATAGAHGEGLFELRVRDKRLRVKVADGEVSFPNDSAASADVVLECEPEVLAELLTGRTRVDEAVAAGVLHVDGRKRAARRFFDIFQLPAPTEAITD